MTSAALSWILSIAGIACAAVFAVVFGAAMRAQSRDDVALPDARLVSGPARRRRGLAIPSRPSRARVIRAIHAAVLALGVTAVFVMFLCLGGVVVIVLVAR